MTPEEKARKEAADTRREQVGLSLKEDDGEGKKSTLITRKRKNKKDEPKEKAEVVEEVKPPA
jgi:translation initiation factor 5B